LNSITAIESAPRAAEAPAKASPRLASLDAFRGLVILTMTFVNYLAGISHIPAWAKHLPADAEGYTFVDLVFPGFLFIVGVSLPLALHKRLARGDSVLALLGRVFARWAALLLVGVIMVNNTRAFSAEATGLSRNLWFLLAMLAVATLWNSYPTQVPVWKQRTYLGLRLFAGVVLGLLLVMFRTKNAAGEVGWLQHSWWGILGLIGWAYLVCALAYLFLRGNSVALMGMLGFLLALYIGDKHGVLDWSWLSPIHELVGIGPVLGSTAANVMIGVLVGNCLLGLTAPSPRSSRREEAPTSQTASIYQSLLTSAPTIAKLALFGVGLYLAGQLVRPLHGINKNAATDAYTLVAGGICCLCFLVVYVGMDVLRWQKWAAPFLLIGQNALLAYILPGLLNNLCSVLGVGGILYQYGSGWPGVFNTAALTLLVLLLTWGATRLGIRLRL
jgi:heparan-alpha-glucosaminide N-acetyltransferase